MLKRFCNWSILFFLIPNVLDKFSTDLGLRTFSREQGLRRCSCPPSPHLRIPFLQLAFIHLSNTLGWQPHRLTPEISSLTLREIFILTHLLPFLPPFLPHFSNILPTKSCYPCCFKIVTAPSALHFACAAGQPNWTKICQGRDWLILSSALALT